MTSEDGDGEPKGGHLRQREIDKDYTARQDV
jgi:hypothetical protein